MQSKLGTSRAANTIRPIAVSSIAMISLPLSMNFGILASTVFGTYLMINALFGAYAYILLSKKSSFHFAELLGLGIAFGTALPALINIIVRLSGITWGSTAPIFPIIGTLVFLLRKSRNVAPKIHIEWISNADLCMILAGPIFAIVAWSDRMWPFCAVLFLNIGFILTFEKQTQKAKWINYFPFLMFVGGAFVNTTTNHIFNRGLIWKSQTGVDIAFDEAQSWSISHLGFYDNVLLAGQPTKGHILTQAWAGDFASFTNAPRFITTAMTGYGVGILGLTAILYFLTYEMSKRKVAARIAITLFLLQSCIPEQFLALPSPRVANSLSMLWLVVFWFLYTANHAKQTRYSVTTLILAMFVVSLAKFQWGLIAALTISIIAITQTRALKGLMARTWKPAVIAITLPITYLLFLKGMDAREEVVFKLQVGMLPLLLVVLLTRTSLVKFPRDASEQSKLLRKFYLISTIFAVLFIWATNAGNQSTYFFYPVLWLSASYLGIRIDKIFIEKQISRNRLLLATFWGISSGACICISYYYLRYRLTDNTKHPILQWVYVSHPEMLQPLALAILLIISIIFAILKTKRQTYSTKTFTHLFILLVIVFNISSNFSNWFLTSNASSITKIWFDVNYSPEYANNSDQYKVADWIIKNTGKSEIGASNFLCDIRVETGGKTPSLNIGSECKNRNMLPWISALTHRRMLIDAPLTSLMGAGDMLEEKFRVNYNAVLAFGSQADSKSFAILQKQGVTWFVVDREQSSVSSWQPFGDITFSTGRYYVLKIRL